MCEFDNFLDIESFGLGAAEVSSTWFAADLYSTRRERLLE
jgi:hypothetical protein